MRISRHRLTLLSPLLVVAASLPAAGAPPAVAVAPPACYVLDWEDGDLCTFSAPAGAFTFGGVALYPGDGVEAEVAVQIRLLGTSDPLVSCFDRDPDVARCQDVYDAPVDGTLTYVCQAFGTGGPKFHCADPPRLPFGSSGVTPPASAR